MLKRGLTCNFYIQHEIRNVKDGVHSCAHARTLFTFSTTIFVKYVILTEYLTLFWFAKINIKLYVSIQKKFERCKIGQCLHLSLWVPFCYEQNPLPSSIIY
jgi:hypothetical protein